MNHAIEIDAPQVAQNLSITQRIDSITHIRADQLRVDPPAPRAVKIELTPRCNLRCGFCSLPTRAKQPKQDMDIETFRRITTEMREAGVDEIGVFYIGESFMNVPLLVEAIDWCKQGLNFPYVFLTTNGSLATPQAVEQCMQAGLDSLKFSVNAATPEQYQEIMGVKEKLFWKSLENIKQAAYVRAGGEARFLSEYPRPRKYDCGLYASSIEYDGEQQRKMEELLDEHIRPYCDETYFLPLYSMATFATAREAELGYTPTAGNQGRLGALVDPLPCWTTITEGHIVSRDGGAFMSVCCFDGTGKFIVADLSEMSFMDAWHCDAFKALRRKHLDKDIAGTICEGCPGYG